MLIKKVFTTAKAQKQLKCLLMDETGACMHICSQKNISPKQYYLAICDNVDKTW